MHALRKLRVPGICHLHKPSAAAAASGALIRGALPDCATALLRRRRWAARDSLCRARLASLRGMGALRCRADDRARWYAQETIERERAATARVRALKQQLKLERDEHEKARPRAPSWEEHARIMRGV